VSVSLSNASLIIAIAQVKVVDGIIKAIQAADANSRAQLPTVAVRPTDSFHKGPALHAPPRYAPRVVVHPTPRYLPRPVMHPKARVEPQGPLLVSHKTSKPDITPPPPAPYMNQPWQQPVTPPPVIKVMVRQPDTNTKGTLIDLFV